MPLGKSPKVREPRFPHLQKGDSHAHPNCFHRERAVSVNGLGKEQNTRTRHIAQPLTGGADFEKYHC